jgi:hypothetical protein
MIDKDGVPRAELTFSGGVCVCENILAEDACSSCSLQVVTSMMESDVVRCPMNVRDFPFDTQTCKLAYQSQSTVNVRPCIHKPT